MKKFIFLIPIFLFGVDFYSCYKKFHNVKSFQITSNLAISFSKPSKYIAYDKLTGMYLYKHKGKPLKFLKHFYLGWEMASIKDNEIYVSNFAKRGFLKDYLAGKVEKNSVISDKFCRAVGIGGEGFFLDKEMISHFIKYKYYGDVPIEFDEDLRVVRFDPFLVHGIKIGDKLLKINSSKANMVNFRKYIVFKPVGERVVLTFAKKRVVLKIIKKIPFKNYLAHYGIKVAPDLRVIKFPKWLYDKYYLDKGAKIIAVNGKKVSNIEEVNSFLKGKNDTITFNDNGIVIKVELNGRIH